MDTAELATQLAGLSAFAAETQRQARAARYKFAHLSHAAREDETGRTGGSIPPDRSLTGGSPCLP
jgi:hypothetical protein